MVVWQPRPEDVQRVFAEQNPWHRRGSVPDSLARPVERPLARHLWRQLIDDEPRRFHLVLGPRRVGKTTVMYQTVRRLLDEGVDPSRVWWLRLDHPLLLAEPLDQLVRAVIEASGATRDRPTYLLLDELVYAEQWDLWLKTFYDDAWPVRVVATSSATAALRDRRVESGVGRWSEHELTPYLFTEYLDLHGGGPTNTAAVPGTSLSAAIRSLEPGSRADPALAAQRRAFMLTGGFPELLDRPRGATADDEPDLVLRSQQVLRQDAVERAVYKDIPQSFGVDNPLLLERLLYVLAGQVTGLLSPTNLCSELGMSQPTFDRYLSYLERAFLVFTLPNYSGREATVQKRGRRLYFVDGAVRNAALQRGLAPLDDPPEMGLLLENLVVASIRSLAAQTGVRLHHWRDGRNEVDLIYDHPEAPLAFEIGSSADHHRDGLRALIERYPRFAGRAYVVAPQASVLHPDATPTGIGTLPLDSLLVATGHQADAALRGSFGQL